MVECYFDNSATTPIDDEVKEAMLPFLSSEGYGNPSSLYRKGNIAHNAIEKARNSVAELLGADSKEIYFTSGGSESDSWALIGYAFKHITKKRIIMSNIEHHAILNAGEFLKSIGYDVFYLPVSSQGIIEPDMLDMVLKDTTCLVSIMGANNEIGTVNDIKALANVCHKHNAVFHSDLVQYVPHFPVNVKEMGIDMASVSGHKINAPKGVGCLYVKEGIDINPIIFGGKQERGLRGGTENVASIVGFGKACELLNKNLEKRALMCKKLRNYFEKQLKITIPECVFNSLENGIPGLINVRFPGMNAVQLQTILSLRGIACSTGSACNSGSAEPSYVLKAIGLSDEEANSSLRFTLSEHNSYKEIDYTIKLLSSIVAISKQ